MISDTPDVFFQSSFDHGRGIFHSPVYPFKDDIPYSTDVKCDQVIRIKVADQLCKLIKAAFGDKSGIDRLLDEMFYDYNDR